MPHMPMSMKITVNMHPNNKIPQFARAALHNSVNEPRYAKNGQETIPKPQNEKNLQRVEKKVLTMSFKCWINLGIQFLTMF